MHAQQLREWINIVEAVDSNYLYHSTKSAQSAKEILQTGYLKPGGPQSATVAQVGPNTPVVSFGRDLQYQLSGEAARRDYQVVFVIDRRKLEQRYKTIGTSQSMNVRGLPYAQNAASTNYNQLYSWKDKFDYDKDQKISRNDLVKASTDQDLPPHHRAFAQRMIAHLFEPKKGKEYEEVVPVTSGKLPLKDILVGFYLVPDKPASQDPELVNHPLRLDMPKPHVFVQANKAT
jgi:hypothetical protein